MSGNNADIGKALAGWLAEKLPHLDNVRIGRIDAPAHAGFSADTVFVDVHCTEDNQPRELPLVMRRQKRGADLFLNSDLNWQCDVMTAMSRHAAVRIPQIVGVETDAAILGSPFYLMHRLPGRVVPQTPNYNLSGWLADLSDSQRGLVWANNIRAIARVHAVDWHDGFVFMHQSSRAPGLDAYMEHIELWFEWAAKGREQPVLDAARAWLVDNKPGNTPVHVLWGDAMSANTLFADDQSVEALLDWEMAALGPGEVDLAWFLMFDDFFSTSMGIPRLSGLPGRNEMVAIYEREAGRKVEHIDYYLVLAMFRLAVIMVRGYDRQLDLGNIRPGSNAITHNPITAMLASHLGLPVPDVGQDFAALMAAGRQ